MHDVPRQLTAAQLAGLFEGQTRLVERLAEHDDPLGAAPQVIRELSERSAAEQAAGGDPVTLTELAYLNQVYEEKFGFRFVVFVNRRSKEEILEVLRQRLERSREDELDTALGELVAIAEDRWHN
jgi:2-oxo-4-hydroxy-4-carboxy--5-ureidoimidazoline (OHCU) decarboxylase